MNKTVDCTFVSVWDGGMEIASHATFDTDTGLVSDIQTEPLSASMLEGCQHLERKYIIVNGCKYAVEKNDDDEYYAIRTYGVFFARCGYAQVKAKSTQDAICIANRDCSLDDISWDEDWNATDAQLEDESYGNNSWAAYCQYLRDWADAHSDMGFEGCCPVCYDEFLVCEWALMQKEAGK